MKDAQGNEIKVGDTVTIIGIIAAVSDESGIARIRTREGGRLLRDTFDSSVIEKVEKAESVIPQ